MHRFQLPGLLLSLLLSPASAATGLDCKNIRVDDHSFDLSKLSGPHSVVTSSYQSDVSLYHNTTYTLDVCQPLKKGKSKEKKECPNGTRVCAISHEIQDEKDIVDRIVAIAGNLENAGGSAFEYEATRLKTSDSNSDSKKEGLRLVLKGGKYPLSGKKREQRAVIEFLCSNSTGTEGEWGSEEASERSLFRRADDKKGDDDKDDKEDDPAKEHQLVKEDSALIWESYGAEKEIDVLRLTWHTKYACEKRDADGDDDEDVPPSWGFFTWFVIIAFLLIAAYLIFGSWLNYNRYGARGWDLLPHGDTLRDVPYLMKDFIRRVLNTVQGTGSRGGYSAV